MRKATSRTGALATVSLAVALSAVGCTPQIVVVTVDRCADPAPDKAEEEAQRERISNENALLSWAIAAIHAGHYANALSALAEHRQRFPDGQHAGSRDRLWSVMCVRVADARCQAATNPAATWH